MRKCLQRIFPDTLNITNVNLFEHQFYADTGGGFVLIGSESNPSVNSFNFQNYFAGNNASSYFIKSLDDIFMLNISFSKIISSKNNIYYADYLMKYKMPRKFKSRSRYGSKRNNTYQFKNFKKKKAKRTMRANF